MTLLERIDPQEGNTALVRIEAGTISESGDMFEFVDDEGFTRHVSLPPSLSYLSEGDIIRVNFQAGQIRVLYRKQSPHNSLFFTERCNSRCIMCSQPPRDINDDYLIDEILAMIPLISPETKEIGITGGEPTLLGSSFLEVLQSLKTHLPKTSVHVLTNGRLFQDASLARAVAKIDHPDIMLGIPLYADVAWKHDFIVQSPGAFEQTVAGLDNLGRAGVPVEIRFVIHKQSAERMVQTARFIARHFPFARQVALMGLEMMGFAKSNVNALWIEPREYADNLKRAVAELQFGKIPTLIYNHQLCLLPSELWPFTCKSISDWKNIYVDECEKCDVRDSCGGFFASSDFRRSSEIRAIKLSVSCPEHLLNKVGGTC